MAKIPELDKPGTIRPWWMTAIVTGQTTNARLPLSHLGTLPRGAILVSLANYVADTLSTADADPGAGNLRWNNATQPSATEVYLDDADSDATDHSALWPTLATGGYLYLYNPANLDVWQQWQITAVTDAAGYLKLGVTWQAGAGNFSDNDAIVVTIQQPDQAAGAVSSVNGDTGAVIVLVPIIIACSDETTALTTGNAKATFRVPYAMTLSDVRASVTAAPTGAALVVDINEGGVSILSTKISIDAGEKSSTTAAAPPVISDAVLAADAEITIDIDTVGSAIAGAGLKVALIGYPS